MSNKTNKKMKKKPLYSEKGFDIFIRECNKWRKVLAPEFDITFKLEDITEFATVEFTLGSGCAEITMGYSHSQHPSAEIKKTALEEILHLCFAEYSNLLDTFYASDFISLQEHKIINKIKSILIV